MWHLTGSGLKMSLERENCGCDARAVSAARLVPVFLWIPPEFADNILLPETVGKRLEWRGSLNLNSLKKIIVFFTDVTEQNSNGVSPFPGPEIF